MATTSTSLNEPCSVARRLASLDHLSGGRAGWDLVTSATNAETVSFGGDPIARHADRYERAEAFVDVVPGLWSPWDDGAEMEARFRARGADGVIIRPATLPGGLDGFIGLVLPELRPRGLFRTAYESHTLRGNPGSRPPAGSGPGSAAAT